MFTSSAFEDGKAIPKKHTGRGDNLSPPLALPAPPEGTKTWAIICDDPDAPNPKKPATKPWVHWVIYNIPADCSELPEDIARTAQPDTIPGARQGSNSWPRENIGYLGPMPPPGSGTHRYFFKLYALDVKLNLSDDAGKDELLQAMKGHILDQGHLMGTYEITE